MAVSVWQKGLHGSQEELEWGSLLHFTTLGNGENSFNESATVFALSSEAELSINHG